MAKNGVRNTTSPPPTGGSAIRADWYISTGNSTPTVGVPRELSLKETADGLRLVQAPAQALSLLRGKSVVFHKHIRPGTTALPFVSAMDNQYEMHAKFSAKGEDIFGLNICADANCHVALAYDTKTHTLTLNRMNGSEVAMPKFERMAFAKVYPAGHALTLDVYVDKSVVEIFVNGGECVMTALAFAPDGGTNAELYSVRGDLDVDMTVSPLHSIWR